MRLLNLLERLGELPAEVWLIPPILILAAMAAIVGVPSAAARS